MTDFKFLEGTVVNLFILLGFVALCTIGHDWAERKQRKMSRGVIGLLFGFMATVAMLVPVSAAPGIIFDSRAGVIGAGAILGGPLVALVSLPLPILYRIHLGGLGMVPGILEMVFPAIAGSLAYVIYRRYRRSLKVIQALITGGAVGLLSNVLVFAYIVLFLPQASEHAGHFPLLIAILNAPVSMALLCAMIVLELQHSAAVDTLADTERRMLHSQKMAAVGQLSRKIAHSYLNAVAAILGSAQIAKDQSSEPEMVEKLMSEVITTVGRLSHLTGELMMFSSPGSLKKELVDVRKCLSAAEKILRETLGYDVDLVVRSQEDMGKVSVDPERIEQLVVHLALNGAEAMSGRGRLMIEISKVTLSRKESARLQAGKREKDRHAGPFCLISVSDTGCGMDRDTVSRVFEPFFTTKEDKRNSGLGLSSVYNIVQHHNGCIDVKSKPGAGSTFLLYLPMDPE